MGHNVFMIKGIKTYISKTELIRYSKHFKFDDICSHINEIQFPPSYRDTKKMLGTKLFISRYKFTSDHFLIEHVVFILICKKHHQKEKFHFGSNLCDPSHYYP